MDLQEKLKEDSEGTWHDLPESDARFKIRPPKPIRITEFRRQCSRPKSRQYPDGLDSDKLAELLLVECLVGWENLSMNGNEFECTDTNKKFIHEEWLDFNKFWNKILIRYISDKDEEHDEDLGN